MEASSSNNMDPQSNKGDRGRPRLEESPSSSHHQSQLSEESILKMSDAFYKFYEPTPAHTADMDIIFFHGLESEGADVHDAHISTWRSGGEQGEVWPQSWIPEDFPQARIIAVSYDCCTRKTDIGGLMDLHLIGENLAQEIQWARKEHGYGRPVILVGHGFGGIVMKMLCVYSKNRKGKAVGGSDMGMLLESIRGFFFYSTPHLGIEGIEAPTDNEGPLLSWIRALNSQTSRLHEEFCELWRERTYRWFIFGLGATELESAPRGQRLRVSEASSRFGDRYMMVASDHFSVCKPSDKSSVKYQHLKMLIEDVKRLAEIKSWAVDGFMEAIGHLTGLESLALHCGGIFELPGSLGKLTRLKKLEIACPIDLVPGSLRELGQLKQLKLAAPVRSLADTSRNLSNLKYLEPMQAGALHSPTSVSLELPRSELGITELQASDLIGMRLQYLKIKVEGPQIVSDCFGGLQRLWSFSLECLAVENNLVESFRNLNALQVLKLQGKGITELPAEFGCFTTLRVLTLERTAVQALPETFGKFSKLYHARFRETPDLRSLPDSFGQLVQLLSLKLEGSEHLSTLPDTVGSLTNLYSLGLQKCRIQTLPASFPDLIGLKYLELRCEDGALAVAVRNLIKLVTLEIEVIGGQPVGDIFGQLSKLERLTLKCHAMENLVESFQNLCLLGYLDLSCKTVEELPREIGCLTTLTNLKIACPSLQSLPDTLSNLLKLKVLVIGESNLRSLPDSFGQLSQLRTLIIWSNYLSTVPDTFGNLSRLLELKLFCPIKLLSASFANLISLRKLKLCCEDGHTAGVLSSLIRLTYLGIEVKTGAEVVLDAVRELGNLQAFWLEFDADHRRSETVRAELQMHSWFTAPWVIVNCLFFVVPILIGYPFAAG
ncbi:hypothetical protein R1sor_012064 [Riccia sorocarpa]|uniref:GPI inositol-deacylase n=1 Tax=Riccia sorocarpa TaxID=122646 RepID=A0ABD3I332_9MARC